MRPKLVGATLAILLATNGLAQAAIYPMVINTWDYMDATTAAWKDLKQNNGTAVTAVVAGVEYCEMAACGGTVGFGGSPDEYGDTNLDACIFDGATMKSGAVGGLRYCKSAIRTAYYVLCHTFHSLLVGGLATDFARNMGLKIEAIGSSASAIEYNNWKADNCQPNFWKKTVPDSETSCGPYTRPDPDPVYRPPPNPWIFSPQNAAPIPQPNVGNVSRTNHDTLSMIVIDGSGNFAAGSSTNGLSHKIPGRVGDASIVGSGVYASNEVGAAICSGNGDVLQRFSPAILAVSYLEAGLSPWEAAWKVVDKVNRWYPNVLFGIVVVNLNGEISAACSGLEEFSYSVINDESCAGADNVIVYRVACSVKTC